MIKYLGSKRALVPAILATIDTLENATTVFDVFSGTARVGHALKREGYRVIANDVTSYAATLATCYVQADLEDWFDDALALVEEFNRIPGQPGYVTDYFCERARYFQPKNGARIDAIRAAIAAKALPPELEAIMLTALIEAADRVDSTTGVQMAYLKSWAARSNNDLELRVPDLLPRADKGKGLALNLDAREAADQVVCDVAYIDPPYNQHSYLGNYHVWETIVRGDEPETFGVAEKRVDVKERKSDFNSRKLFMASFVDLLDAIDAHTMVVSFSNEGFATSEEIRDLLAHRMGGEVHVIEQEHPRYVGAKIGIHGPTGERVGEVSHLRNSEYLFVATSK
jgi:adenine-specific DNA-methyltransferase